LNNVRFLELITEELLLVEQRMREPDPDQHEAVHDAVMHLLSSGGKRVRPIIVLLVGKLLAADCERAINLAAAVEMLHTATLVHDDIIDGSLVRRGNPTLNATWSPGATILTGDYLFARAADLAAQTDSVPVMRLFAKALMTICNGELQQMFSSEQRQVDRGDYYRRIYAKTGSLFVLAAEASGALAQVDDRARLDLRRYGKELGIAFQIVDDLLDFVGDETRVGKPLGSDLAQGLITLPTICFLEAFPDDRRVLDVLDGQRSPKHIKLALEAVRGSEAVGRVMAEAKHHAALAQAAMVRLPDNGFRQSLLDLADYAVQREL
jgi:geranylgeranyl pyrophosphate synthase